MKRRTEFHCAYPGFVRGICESPISIIVIENVLAILRQIQVDLSVVVVIAEDAAQSISIAWNTGFIRYIGEYAVTIILIEGIAGQNAAIVKVSSVDEVNILRPVVVIITDTDAGPGLFEDGRYSVIAFEMNEIDSCCLCLVGKPGG